MKYEITLAKAFVLVIFGFTFISDVILWLLLNAVRVIINKPYVPFSIVAAWFAVCSRELVGVSIDDVCDLAEDEADEFFNKEDGN